MKKTCLLLLLIFIIIPGYAVARDNGKFDVRGTVVDGSDDSPVCMAAVIVKELNLWAQTDEKGYFEIKNVPAGEFTFEVSILGYETRVMHLDVSEKLKPLHVRMNVSSLTLSDVVVTAREGGEMTTASKISKQTIEHIQPSSLKDVMQLLPGSVTDNPSLTKSNSLSIRDIGNNVANALGTSLVVDGATLSNDANLQMLTNGNAMNNSEENTASSAGGGVDARQVSTDNIESVEVIRGIPSVVYGDMTSGAVVVKTKVGVTPWEVRVKTDPHLKQASLGKGFSLGDKSGMMNFDADYAYAYSDIRTPSSAYQRINFQAGYSNTFGRKLQFNAKLHGNWSDASNKSDPDLKLDEITRQRDMGLRLNINGRWIADKAWLSNIEYLLAGSITHQHSQDRSYQGSAGYTPVTTIKEDKEWTGEFTSPQYYSDVNIYGRPIDAQAKITAHQMGKYGTLRNKALIGFEWKMEGNTGEGKIFDPLCPPDITSVTSYRNRSYSEIPFLHRLTAFAEDNVKFPIGATSLEIQGGARINSLTASKINTQNFFCVEPRGNVRYALVKKKKGLRELSIRGGWGLNCKMPSMVYLFPEAAYKDMVSFNYNDFDANKYGINVITTKTVETTNISLKPQRSRNIEAGIEFDSDIVGGSLVYFNEKMTDGYGFSTEYVPMEYRRYGYSWKDSGHSTVVQNQIGSGVQFNYLPGNLKTTTGQQISYITDTTFMQYKRPVNDIRNDKWGIEFTLDFKKIKAINTSISISGAYMHLASNRGGYSSYLYGGSSGGRTYPYVGIYAGSSTSSNGSIKDRFSMNTRFVTHIPSIAMVFTLTAQTVFYESSQAVCQMDGASLPYFYNENGERISGDEALYDTEHTKYINPVMIMDRTGKLTEFTQEMEKDPEYADLIVTTNTGNYYLRQSYPFYAMLNLRVTKEIKDIATVSFYANNFLNMRGRVLNSVTGYPIDKNSPIYFGAEVKVTIR